MSTSNCIYAEAKTAVFWDIEDCKIPNGLDAVDVSHNIRTALTNVGYHGTVSIKAYGDRTTAGFFSAEIELVHVPAEHTREKLEEILTDFFVWAMDHREPSNLMLLVGDISEETAFLDGIQFLRSHNYNILLAQPQVPSGVLVTIPTSAWLWESLSAGGKPINHTGSSQSVDNTTSACSGSSQCVTLSPTPSRSRKARLKRRSKDFSAVDIRTDGAAQPLSPEGVAELQATYDLTLMECGNLHMQAAQNLFLSADNEMPSPEQLQSEFERVKQKYTLAKKCYDQALLVNPGLYVVFRALGELQVMMAKFHLDLAVQQNTDLSSWDSTEALELFDSAAENIEKWEKHGENGEASSEQMKFWGSMLFERSQVECISGVEGWEENLDSAVKYLRDGHVSEHQILSLLNNHYSREPKSEATSKTLGESEFVAKIKADKVKVVTQAKGLCQHTAALMS